MKKINLLLWLSFGGLKSGKEYNIEVKALDSYDNESSALVATFKTN